jgi:septal ring factor EnvC (AmiA/AmiB activator)
MNVQEIPGGWMNVITGIAGAVGTLVAVGALALTWYRSASTVVARIAVAEQRAANQSGDLHELAAVVADLKRHQDETTGISKDVRRLQKDVAVIGANLGAIGDQIDALRQDVRERAEASASAQSDLGREIADAVQRIAALEGGRRGYR